MKYTFFKYFAILGILSISLASCIKDTVNDLTTEGKPFLKILESPTNAIFFEPFSTVKKVDVFSLRRDANSEAELNKSVTIKLKVDTAAIRAYNTSKSETFELLPDSLFTLGAGITKTGTLSYEMVLAPGEFAKDFSINLNGAKWDLAHKYAMPITVQDAGGLTVVTDKDDILALISIKNKYDGKYKVTSTLVDAAVATITAKSPTEAFLVTTGPSSVKYYNSGTAIGSFKELYPISNAGSESAYGSFLPVFYFDANNNVTKVENFYGQPAGNTRSAELDPSGINKYDPATKTLKVKFFMKQPNTITSAPFIRTSFDVTMEYLGPR